MTDTVLDSIILARVGLLLRHPFFGNIATRFPIVDGSDWCDTAATDGKAIYYNRDFFATLSDRNIEFVFAHEVLHMIFDHMTRVEGRDHTIWGYAADYAVNGQLVRDSIGDHRIPGIKIVHDTAHYGKSTEQIYDELYEKAEKIDISQLGDILDEHHEWDAANDDSKGGGRPRYTKDELKQIRDQITEAVLEAAQACSAGNVPDSVQRLLKQLTEPRMNWRQLLRQQIQSTIRSDYTWARPSRKGWHTGAVLPGTNLAETIDVCVAIDTSGSISDSQVVDFLSEVKGIMEEYKDFNMKVWTFDTSVHNPVDYNAYDNDISAYKITGGGGTEFMCNWDFMKENDITPKKLIVFSDMEAFGSFGDPDYCDTLFVSNNSHREIEAPFGITVQYDDGLKK